MSTNNDEVNDEMVERIEEKIKKEAELRNIESEKTTQAANNMRVAFHDKLKSLLTEPHEVVEADLLVTNSFFVLRSDKSFMGATAIKPKDVVKVITDDSYRNGLLSNPALSLTKMTFDKFDSMDTIKKQKLVEAIRSAGNTLQEKEMFS